MIGQTISHYRITEKLGEGGMGVVYRAEDTKLKRTVALKFLAAHLLNDEETKARFQREAEAAAALTHSNIAVIHDIDESEGHSFIAMEFVEGLTVSKKVAERPLKLDEALDLSGNVWEWCLNEYGKPDCIQLGGQGSRVLRGGSWNNNQDNARAGLFRWATLRFGFGRRSDRLLACAARLVDGCRVWRIEGSGAGSTACLRARHGKMAAVRQGNGSFRLAC